MRSLKSIVGFGVVFAAAFAVAQVSPVAASPADDGSLAELAASATAADGGVVVDQAGRGPGGRGPARAAAACLRLAHAVKKACPCNGPEGSGYENGHEGYVECVSQALDAALAGNENPKAAECATKILERATASQIGEPGFVCPERKRCDAPEAPEDPEALGDIVDHGRHPRRHPRPCPTAEPTVPPTP